MSELAHYRRSKDQFFASEPHSPLSADQRKAFESLRYYPEDPALRFDLKLERFPRPEVVHMQTSTGEVREYYRFGTLQFAVDGTQAALTIFGSHEGDAFVPFTDATSGHETYGAGRYLDLEWNGGDRFHLDSYLAYNTWCAFPPGTVAPSRPGRTGWQSRSALARRT